MRAARRLLAGSPIAAFPHRRVHLMSNASTLAGEERRGEELSPVWTGMGRTGVGQEAVALQLALRVTEYTPG